MNNSRGNAIHGSGCGAEGEWAKSFDLGHPRVDKKQREDRPRIISFHEPLTTAVHAIPLRSAEENGALFYSRLEFASFQAKEQRRYDKMMMQRIQEMVEEAMKDKLEEAYARNASPEEIDTMMPQSTEAIFELLGGVSALDIPKPPSAAVFIERTDSSSDIDIPKLHCSNEGSLIGVDEEGDTLALTRSAQSNRKEDILDDALSSISRNIEKSNDEEQDPVATNEYADQKKWFEDTLPDTSDESQYEGNRERLQMQHRDDATVAPGEMGVIASIEDATAIEKNDTTNGKLTKQNCQDRLYWVGATDEEIYDMFGLEYTTLFEASGDQQEIQNDVPHKDGMFKADHDKPHLRNEDPSELVLQESVLKKNQFNEFEGMSVLSEVQLEDLASGSRKNLSQESHKVISKASRGISSGGL